MIKILNSKILIGVFVAFSAFFTYYIMFSGKQFYYVIQIKENVNELHVGARVTINGIKVGKVRRITPLFDSDDIVLIFLACSYKIDCAKYTALLSNHGITSVKFISLKRNNRPVELLPNIDGVEQIGYEPSIFEMGGLLIEDICRRYNSNVDDVAENIANIGNAIIDQLNFTQKKSMTAIDLAGYMAFKVSEIIVKLEDSANNINQASKKISECVDKVCDKIGEEIDDIDLAELSKLMQFFNEEINKEAIVLLESYKLKREKLENVMTTAFQVEEGVNKSRILRWMLGLKREKVNNNADNSNANDDKTDS